VPVNYGGRSTQAAVGWAPGQVTPSQMILVSSNSSTWLLVCAAAAVDVEASCCSMSQAMQMLLLHNGAYGDCLHAVHRHVRL
jgi:hypothetical protein